MGASYRLGQITWTLWSVGSATASRTSTGLREQATHQPLDQPVRSVHLGLDADDVRLGLELLATERFDNGVLYLGYALQRG